MRTPVRFGPKRRSLYRAINLHAAALDAGMQIGRDHVARLLRILVIKGVHRLGRRLQIFDRTGPGVDHPVFSNCLESRYLKVLWARVV